MTWGQPPTSSHRCQEQRRRPAAGAAPRAISSGSFTDGHVLAKRGKLLPSQSEDAAKTVRRVEAPHSIAFVDDAAGEAWADAGQPRDLLHGRVIDVQRP